MSPGIGGGLALGIDHICTAKEMCDPAVDHLSVMAFAASYKNRTPVRQASLAEKISVNADLTQCKTNHMVGPSFYGILGVAQIALSPGNCNTNNTKEVYLVWYTLGEEKRKSLSVLILLNARQIKW